MTIRSLLRGAVAAIALSAGLAFLLGATETQAQGACSPSSGALDAAEQQMIDIHNAVRAANGLGPLRYSPALSTAAAMKSEDASSSPATGNFSHTDTLGRGPSERAAACGYPGQAAENIAYGYASAQATFDAWMASPGHRQNILMSYYTTIGVGRVGDRWTVDYGIVDDGGAPAASAPAPAPAAAAPAAPPPPPPPPPGIQLPAGTSLVTYGGSGGWTADLFAEVADRLLFVYRYDPARGEWLRYHPGAESWVNSLAWMEPGAYYVGMSSGGAVHW